MRPRTLGRPRPGAGVGGLQHRRSPAREQGGREHQPLARTLLPSGAAQNIRARAIPEERRKPPRLFTQYTLHVLHRGRRGGRVQGAS